MEWKIDEEVLQSTERMNEKKQKSFPLWVCVCVCPQNVTVIVSDRSVHTHARNHQTIVGAKAIDKRIHIRQIEIHQRKENRNSFIFSHDENRNLHSSQTNIFHIFAMCFRVQLRLSRIHGKMVSANVIMFQDVEANRCAANFLEDKRKKRRRLQM